MQVNGLARFSLPLSVCLWVSVSHLIFSQLTRKFYFRFSWHEKEHGSMYGDHSLVIKSILYTSTVAYPRIVRVSVWCECV